MKLKNEKSLDDQIYQGRIDNMPKWNGLGTSRQLTREDSRKVEEQFRVERLERWRETLDQDNSLLADETFLLFIEAVDRDDQYVNKMLIKEPKMIVK